MRVSEETVRPPAGWMDNTGEDGVTWWVSYRDPFYGEVRRMPGKGGWEWWAGLDVFGRGRLRADGRAGCLELAVEQVEGCFADWSECRLPRLPELEAGDGE